ncbi:hypothetical protein QJQ45_008293 [Haematococcus lacustris]|nr:hypothetical protein QJQ45_008293 [Haematococcus lacustris]
MPLALAVKASASPSLAASSTLPCIVGPGLKPNLPYALPFAANPSVAAGLSLADQRGTHHAVPGVMLDSGSAATMLTTTLAQQLQLHLMPCQQRVIQSGGVAFQVLGAVMVEVGLGVGGTHPALSRHRALVVADTPSLPYNALIGTDIFYKHGVQLDLPGRLLSYAPRLASHREPQPRHAMPLFFVFPATASSELLSLSAAPLWACAALPEPASDGGAYSGSSHTSASYLGAPGVAPMATSATPGCSHAPSVAEDQPGADVRGLPPAPRSKPGRGMDRPQLPTRTPKFSKGISVRALCHTLLLLLCTLVHGTLPSALPPATSLFSGSTISITLPDGQQHLPPDVRFTKHAKGMLFGNHPGMLATQRAALQSLVETHDSAFSYSLSDLPGYHGPRPPFSIPLTTTEPVRSPPRRYSPIERQICTDKTAELQAAGIVSPVEGPCSYAAAPVLPAKKDVHGNWTEKRFAIDFRQLNAATQPDIYGLPRPEEMFTPIIRLTGKGVPWQWEEQQQQAFATLKAALCTPGLVLRRADPGHHARWALSLQDYNFTILHRPGIKYQNADVLSRWPLPCDDDGTGARLDPDQPAAALASFPPTAAPLDSVVQSCASYWPFNADYATHPADLLLGNLGGELDATCHAPAPITTYATTALQRLQHTAAAMLSRAASSLACLTPAVTCLGLASGPQDTFGVARPVRLNTNLVANSFFPSICHKGVVLLELFGGLCAGLDMCLRNGISVHQYIYCDTDPAAQHVAHHRLAHLSAQYPAQLPPCAYVAAFTTLPSDVHHVTTKQLVHCGATAGRQWLVVAGRECQDLSPAGSQAVMHGPHSSTHTACLRIVGALRQLQRSLPPAYIFENAAVQHNFISSAVREQLQPLCHMFGEPLCFDAAMVGSFAHRVRNYWTNLCDTAAAACVLAHATRGPIQPFNVKLWASRCGHYPPWWPLLGLTPSDTGGPGRMLNSDGTTSEPTVGERERALVYGTGATAAARVTQAQRFAILGRCMDAYAMQSLLAVAHALYQPPAAAVHTQLPPNPASCACMLGGSSGTLTTEHATPVGSAASPACLAAALTAAAEETSDIHTDTATLHLLRTGAHQSGLSATELRRVLRRAKAYWWEKVQLRRVMADGGTKLVPPPAVRDQHITTMHASNGHLGVRRTTAMLLYSYWWPGVHADVARVLKSCHVCDRARASFNLRDAQLSPLPVASLFYRWGVDLAGPLPRTHRGNEYLMVCIEHLTNHVELVPIPDRLASTTAYHFNHQVLGRFGASAEVVTDGGREFKGEFADLLLRYLIDHRVTSPHHPQADGLAERAVQTGKEALRKHIVVAGDPAAWDEALPAIALGYRVYTVLSLLICERVSDDQLDGHGANGQSCRDV